MQTSSKSSKRSTRNKQPRRLALTRQVFPPQLVTEMEFDWPLVVLTTTLSATDYLQLCPNSPTQYDYNNKLGFGAVVPNMYPYLVNSSGTGPYRRYRVESWESKFTIVNDATYPVDIFFVHSELPLDDDTQLEMRNALNVQHHILDVKGGGRTSLSFTTRGSADTATPAIVDGSYEGGQYNAVPTQRIYQSFFLTQASYPMRYFFGVRTKLRVRLFDRYTPNF